MKSFLRILSFINPYWLVAFIALIASIFYGIFNAISLWVVGSLIGTIMGQNSTSFVGKIESSSLIGSFGNYFEGDWM